MKLKETLSYVQCNYLTVYRSEQCDKKLLLVVVNVVKDLPSLSF
jgi:hypothetical protein